MLNIDLVVDALKREAIHEYEKLLKQWENGYMPKYNFLLDLISYINLDKLDELINQYFLNAKGFLHFGK